MFPRDGASAHRDALGLAANFQHGIDDERAVGVDGDAGSPVGLETRLFDTMS
jgi:hypothetical protein